MDSIYQATLFFIVVSLSALVATGALLPLLRKHSILDIPNNRSSHDAPTPKGGGIALISVILLAWIASGIYLESNIFLTLILPAMALVLAGISWIDDLRGLPPIFRLIVQTTAVTAILTIRPAPEAFFQGLLPLILDNFLAGIIWVWFINLFNFMDGIDGITGTETIIIGVGIALICNGHVAVIGGLLAAASAGFIRWNWHPAKIFLGDVGSVPLGFLVGWLLLNMAGNGMWAAAVILPSYYLFDASITLIRRALKREKIWQPHRQHFYQKAVERGLSQTKLVSGIALIGILLISLALLAEDVWTFSSLSATVIVNLLFLIVLRGRQS